MGRLTEAIDYLNAPSDRLPKHISVYYENFVVSERSKVSRSNYRSILKAEQKKHELGILDLFA